MRIGLVSNVRSERNKDGLASIERLAAADENVRHFRFDGTRSLACLLRELAADRTELLVINSGDGTVQGILTALLEERPFSTVPPIAILPRGMANMTAADVGLKGSSARTLARLIETARQGDIRSHVVERRVLRVANIQGASPQRGMFLGAAAIYEAIEICKARVHSLGLKGELAHAATLAWLLLTATLQGLEAVGMHGHEIDIAVDGRPASHGRRLLLLATTLNRLVLGSRPFWNADAQPVRFTSIAHPAPRIVQRAWQVLYGDSRRDLPADVFQSGGAQRLELGLGGSFTIDGEHFEPIAGQPIVVTAPDIVGFVRL